MSSLTVLKGLLKAKYLVFYLNIPINKVKFEVIYIYKNRDIFIII